MLALIIQAGLRLAFQALSQSVSRPASAGSRRMPGNAVDLTSHFGLFTEATFEDSNTRHIHTSGDTIEVEGFSFDHMAQFVQLATAFVLELSA